MRLVAGMKTFRGVLRGKGWLRESGSVGGQKTRVR